MTRIAKRLHTTAQEQERAFLVAAQPKRNGAGSDGERALDELALLAETAGASVVGRSLQKIERPNPAHYVGPGKLAEIVARRQSAGYTVVIFDDELSPSQQRNLERTLEVKVLDRTALILDIFALRARTREGRLQVELAQSEYLLPRLAGQWSHLERLGSSGARGAIGVRGPGETQLETDRRLARNKVGRLKREIEAVRRQRSLYRRRRARSGLPIVALVGYTNAGKSTLMRALTEADVLVENQLFATLDPVTRRVRLPSGTAMLLTDTVGFIQKLPTQLVAAFRATLEELAEADLLLHVIDVTHPDVDRQRRTVEATVGELGLSAKPRLNVLNKIDLLADDEGSALAQIQEPADKDAVAISAERGWSIGALLSRIDGLLLRQAEEADHRAPAQRRDAWTRQPTAP